MKCYRLYLLIIIAFAATNCKANDFANESIGFSYTDSIIGKPVPDFVLKAIINNKANVKKMSDFKGKPLIIDFWATWCKPCVALLPRIDKLEEEFSNQANIVSMTSDKIDVVEKFLKRINKFDSIHLTIVAEASEIQNYFNIHELPHYAWIDKNGILKAITSYEDVTGENVRRFIQTGLVDRKDVKQPLVGAQYYDSANINIINLFNRNPSKVLSAVKYQSVLTGYLNGLGFSYLLHYVGDPVFKGRMIRIRNLRLVQLYQLAYGGEFFNGKRFPDNRTAFEVKDTVRYVYFPPFDSTYCYQLIIGKDDSHLLFRTMQEDLQRYFGLNAYIERRTMNCWALVAKDTSVLLTKGGKPSIDYNKYFYKCQNKPVRELVSAVEIFYYGMYNEKPIIVDETGITSNVDLDISANMSDIGSLCKDLKRYKLDLIPVQRNLDILVIRDY